MELPGSVVLGVSWKDGQLLSPNPASIHQRTCPAESKRVQHPALPIQKVLEKDPPGPL